jgi:hypothetical protein
MADPMCQPVRKFSPAGWLKALYNYGGLRPTPHQRGIANVSMRQLCAITGSCRSTIQRALRWAAQSLFAIKLRRGHRITEDRADRSQWQLQIPPNVSLESDIGS